jgi:hypothetical protein
MISAPLPLLTSLLLLLHLTHTVTTHNTHNRAMTNGRISLRERDPLVRCSSEQRGSAGNDRIGSSSIVPQQPDVLNGMKGKPQGMRVLNKQLSAVM